MSESLLTLGQTSLQPSEPGAVAPSSTLTGVPSSQKEAILMAQLAGLLLALVAEPAGFVAFFVGLVVFLLLMLRSKADRVHFRFGVVFGIECLLLPIVVSIAPHEMDSRIWGMDAGLWLALSISLGVVMGLSSLFIAVFLFRD
jgi:hypothetical protein